MFSSPPFTAVIVAVVGLGFVAQPATAAWFTSPPAPSFAHLLLQGDSVCPVNATGDNATLATDAFVAAIAACREQFPAGGVVYFPGTERDVLPHRVAALLAGSAPAPRADGAGRRAGAEHVYKVDRSIALADNITVLVGANATLQFAVTPGMAVDQNPACDTLYWSSGGTGLLCGANLTNVAVVGLDSATSTVDGGGWPWYEAQLFGQGPRLFEPTWSKNVTVASIVFRNSPSWTVHPTYCEDVLADHITISNPRFTPNTDGFDPDSSVNVVLRDSLIDTGDDGISVKSGNVSGSVQMPARNIHIYRTTILSRNFCVGSATFGGVYDMVMEDCIIGDDNGSSPWAIKYKSHQNYPGTMQNHTFRRIRVGNIQPNPYQQPDAGYFMSIELRYHPLIPNRTCAPWECPSFRDIHFEDMVITGAHRAGDINGFPGDLLEGLTFKNVTFVHTPTQGWTCGYVNTTTSATDGMDPPLDCKEGPAATAATVAAKATKATRQ